MPKQPVSPTAFRTEVVTVNPGDFDALNPDNPNTRFRRLAGLRGAHNRAIDPGAVAALSENWKSVVYGGTPIVLWQENPTDKHYYIVSGQHRIMMAADTARYEIPGPISFRAEIRTPASIPLAGSLPDQVFVANLHARRQDVPQNLEIFQASSPWCNYANRIGWAPSFTSEQDQNQMSWKAIIHAALVAEYLMKSKDMGARIPHIDQNKIISEFVKPTTRAVKILDILKRWEDEVCKSTDAFRREHRTRLRFRRHDALVAAIILHLDPANAKHGGTLADAPNKVRTSPEIAQIVPKSIDRYPELAKNLLAVVNHRRTGHRVSMLNIK